ncbi:sulfurtransferase [Candidatus Nitrosotenuis aquarius]|uniref:sulfurtransferase n=1 Tax=Candidatus Nitrosotenuis aquarius TaxID=1846278 RepID=UPI000C1EBAB9|nr:sulfurtransferase [Candidatus Nitrosotenuis aquarius]
MLISTANLAKELQNQNLVLIDARSYKEYSQGHIPGAVNLDLFAYHWFDTTPQGMQIFNEQTKKLLSFVGVTMSKKIVFYDDVSGMLAARGVWLLMYFSHQNVFMLDGGIKKWQADGLTLETKTNGFFPTTFDGNPNLQILADYEHVLQNIGKSILIDARSKEEFNGDVIRGARRGHIPRAINVDFSANISEDGTIKNEKQLEELYKIPKDAQIITYCQGAYRAANSFLALKKLGFEKIRVYLGSWGEWSNRTELPVE